MVRGSLGALSNVAIPLLLECDFKIIRCLEPISKSPEEDNKTGELDKAEEVLGVVLPACCSPTGSSTSAATIVA
jgi:hypothetical protein